MTTQPKLAWIDEAFKHLGLAEIPGSKHNPEIVKWLKTLNAAWKDDETPWCGTFIAWCLYQAGFTRSKSTTSATYTQYPYHWYRALAYQTGGAKLKKPCYGCVAIKTRVGGGHVCFVVGVDQKTGKLVCLGGNQSNKVCLALYAASEFEEFRWYGKTANPLQIRYSLPVYSGTNLSAVTSEA